MRNSILSLEQESFNNTEINKYLYSLEDKINIILSEKYGEEIIKYSYLFFKDNIESRIGILFNDIIQKLNELFESLIQEINNNLPKFKYSIEGFHYMAKIFNKLISDNVIKNYFDSIIEHQKNEFNFTISYYYNYLIKIINTTHLEIINGIPTNEILNYNNINLKKIEINNELNNILQLIFDSKNETLNINKQINTLKVEEYDFFKLNSFLNNNITYINKLLFDKIENINKINNNKLSDEYSIASNLYLENSENGKQIKNIYEIILDKVFINLDTIKFKQLLLDNWIFDLDDFINKLNLLLYNSSKEILNDFLIKKENYIVILEKEIVLLKI